ncbi:DUF4189 domain-containing protein [Variovorax sp. Root318D1]|uniref:DUF4189 domain-containing protein n=1 Tax=Variovorax sp. Root318D1 TaxID=1736513 RepID=UPI0009E91FE2|nr:DUF4189 domain-containing protein [Variovorax sp. Root318D1]
MSAHLLYRLLVVGLWLLCASAVHAEGGFCPPGTIDHNNGRAAAIVCSPIPGYGQQQAPQPPPQQWERRWGAVAIDEGPTGSFGVATDKRSKQEAANIAMDGCRQQGGANCKIQAAYDNECVAVVAGEGGYNVPTDLTVGKAVATGMKTCRDAGRANCHVHYSACSMPVRIQ